MSERPSVQPIFTESQLCYFSRQFSNMFGMPVRLYRQQEKIYTYSPVQLAADPVTLCIDALGLKDIVLIGWSTGNLDTWSYVQQFGKDKLRGVVTIDMSPLPLSPDPKWWTEGTIEELSQVATQVLTSSQGCREFFSEYATGVMIQHKMEPDELEYLLDISGRTPYWICRQLFCDAVFSNYLEIAKDVGATMPSLMFVAEHWQDIAKPFVETQLPGYDTYVMGGHLMFYEYPEKWNRVLEDFLNKL